MSKRQKHSCIRVDYRIVDLKRSHFLLSRLTTMSDGNVNSENIDCLWWGLPAGNFPCDASPIEAVSFAVVCGGISLLFVAFLMKNVRTMQP